MKRIFTIFISCCVLIFSSNSYSTLVSDNYNTETIIMIRHGEKPLVDIGQLNCQGLNRALKLPQVILQKFGKPDYLFAADPANKVPNELDGTLHHHFRPLMTLEPLAIQFGLPVNVVYGYSNQDSLVQELMSPKYMNSKILMAWEHKRLIHIARSIYTMMPNNSAELIPKWEKTDFDSIYIFEIQRDQTNLLQKITFKIDAENLNGLSENCPN